MGFNILADQVILIVLILYPRGGRWFGGGPMVGLEPVGIMTAGLDSAHCKLRCLTLSWMKSQSSLPSIPPGDCLQLQAPDSQLPGQGHLVSPGQRPQKVTRPSLDLWVTVGGVGPEAAQHWLLCPDSPLRPVP